MPERTMDLVVVTGGPGVGKTTFAKTLGRPVLDLDDILLSMGATRQHRSIDQISAALAVRNQRLRLDRGWTMITNAPQRAARMFWAKVWQARVIHLQVDGDEWQERVTRDAFQGGGYDRTQALRSYIGSMEPDEAGDPIEANYAN
jgi:adenylate kinase family enzyme